MGNGIGAREHGERGTATDWLCVRKGTRCRILRGKEFQARKAPVALQRDQRREAAPAPLEGVGRSARQGGIGERVIGKRMGCGNVHLTPIRFVTRVLGGALAAGVGRIGYTALEITIPCIIGAICIGVRGGQQPKRAGREEEHLRARLGDEHIYWRKGKGVSSHRKGSSERVKIWRSRVWLFSTSSVGRTPSSYTLLHHPHLAPTNHGEIDR